MPIAMPAIPAKNIFVFIFLFARSARVRLGLKTNRALKPISLNASQS